MIWWILAPVPLAPILFFSCAKKKKLADELISTHEEPEVTDAGTEFVEPTERTQRPEETEVNRILDQGLVLPTIREQTLMQTMGRGATERGPGTMRGQTTRSTMGSMATVAEPMTLALEAVPDYGTGGFGTTRDLPTTRPTTTRTQAQAPPQEPPTTRRWAQPPQTQALPQEPPTTRRWTQQTQGPSRWAPKTQPPQPVSQAPRGRTFAQPQPSRYQPPEPSVRPPAALNVKPAKDPQKVSPAESDYATLPAEPHMMPEISNL